MQAPPNGLAGSGDQAGEGVCAAIGVALAIAGTSAVVGFATLDTDEAREVEDRLARERPAAAANP